MNGSKRVRLVPWHSLTRDGQKCRLDWLEHKQMHSEGRERLMYKRLSNLCRNLYYYGVINPMRPRNASGNVPRYPEQTANAAKAYDP